MVEDIIWAVRSRGEAGTNIGRAAGVLAGSTCPAPRQFGTARRHCNHPMASHSLRYGEGDVFIAGGVEP